MGGIDYSVFIFSSFMKNCRSRLLLVFKPVIAVFAINWQIPYFISQNFIKPQHHPYHTYRNLWSCHGALKGFRLQTLCHMVKQGLGGHCQSLIPASVSLWNSFKLKPIMSIPTESWVKRKTGEEHIHHQILWETRGLTCEHKGGVLTEQNCWPGEAPQSIAQRRSKKNESSYCTIWLI